MSFYRGRLFAKENKNSNGQINITFFIAKFMEPLDKTLYPT